MEIDQKVKSEGGEVEGGIEEGEKVEERRKREGGEDGERGARRRKTRE